MTRRLQTVLALVLALSVLAILVSPFAASELTTIRSPQKMRPPVIAVPLALYAPMTAWVMAPAHAAWEAEAQLVLPGSEIVSLTCGRLC